MTYLPNHHRVNTKGCVYEHILVMEEKIGRSVVQPKVVHHIDGDQSNNDPNNLMLFENDFVHQQYHKRMRALKACGNANYVKCNRCKNYGDPGLEDMTYNGRGYIHRKCKA